MEDKIILSAVTKSMAFVFYSDRISLVRSNIYKKLGDLYKDSNMIIELIEYCKSHEVSIVPIIFPNDNKGFEKLLNIRIIKKLVVANLIPAIETKEAILSFVTENMTKYEAYN